MKATYSHKMHRFTDCMGFHWRMPADERAQYVTPDLRHVTCSTCKQRILNAISAADWRGLDEASLAVLERAALQAG